MKKILVMLLVFSFLLPGAAFSMSGMDIYNKYKSQEKKFESQNMILEIETKSSGMVLKGKVYKKGKKSRVENTMVSGPANMMMKPGETMVIISDEKTTTIISPTIGTRTENEDEDEDEDVKPGSVDYLGKEKVSGMNCLKIKANFLYNEKEILWIDAKDYSLVKEISGFEGEESTTINSDFKKIKGFKIPFKSLVYENGELTETRKLTSVKINPKIKDSLFNPKKVKGYKASKNDSPMNMMEKVMSIRMQIVKHYENGEPEKAKALEKKLLQLTGQQ